MIDCTLVIIDMQPVFPASKADWVLSNTKKEIQRAKRYKNGIILVRYQGSGGDDFLCSWQINRKIIHCVFDYTKVAFVTKKKSNASSGIVRAIDYCNFPKNKIRIIGVNTDSCVADTVQGLSKKLPKSTIYVVKKACHSDHCFLDYQHYDCLIEKNVKLL